MIKSYTEIFYKHDFTQKKEKEIGIYILKKGHEDLPFPAKTKIALPALHNKIRS